MSHMRSHASAATVSPATTPEINDTDGKELSVLSLDAAISKLESGEDFASLMVDLGGGINVSISVDDGLLQRLVGHRHLSGIAKGTEGVPAPTHHDNDETIWVATEVRNLIAMLSPN